MSGVRFSYPAPFPYSVIGSTRSSGLLSLGSSPDKEAMKEIECSFNDCNIKFIAKNSLHAYCSPKHRQLAGTARRIPKLLDRECQRLECSEKYQTKDHRQKFCSRTCFAIQNNKSRPKKYSCLRCSKELNRRLKFCSEECKKLDKNDKTVVKWLDGEISGSNKNGIMKSWVRKYLMEESNWHCQNTNCAVPGGWSVPNPKLGYPILTVDHIDGDWKNNSRSNLIVICFSCHTLTETFGSLNHGSGSGTRVNYTRIDGTTAR